MNPDKTHEFRLGSISAPDELAELWAIDKTAYGEASSRLVARLPSGIDGSELESRHRWRNRLVASFRPFCGTPHKCPNEGGRCDGPHDAPFRKTPARKWYISGMVRRPEFIGTCAIRVLVGDGLCHWFNRRDRRPVPTSCPPSPEAEDLLTRFGFHCWQKAHAMPDGIALFALDLVNREDRRR